MSEFDELLAEVLADEVCVEPPLGMERRIRAKLFAATEPRVGARSFWREAIAAMVLLGVVGYVAARHRHVAPVTTMPPVASFAADAMPPGMDGTKDAPVQRTGAVRRSAVVRFRAKRGVAKVVVDVEPLTVAPLTVAPIEVAALRFDGTTRSMNEGAR